MEIIQCDFVILSYLPDDIVKYNEMTDRGKGVQWKLFFSDVFILILCTYFKILLYAGN